MAESNKPKHAQSESQRRKGELSADLARSRSGISLHAGQVRYQADVNRRVKLSFRSHVGSWLTGAVLTGGLISLLPARRKKVYVNPLGKSFKGKVEMEAKPPQGFMVSLLLGLVPIIKPALTAFVTKQLANVVGGAKEAQKTAENTTRSAERTAQAAAE